MATESGKPASDEHSKNADPKDVPIDSIGWLFIQRYYSVYTTEIKKLSELYDKHAVLHHEAFPKPSESGQAPVKTAYVARGSDSITQFFNTSQSSETNKIVIESAEFQNSAGGSILIMVSGSWMKGTSNLKPFVQTFILTSKEHTVYDVSNDILKFIDLTEKLAEKKVITVEAEQKPQEAVPQAKEQPEESPKEESAKPETEPKPETGAKQEPEVKEAKEEATSEAPKPAAGAQAEAAKETHTEAANESKKEVAAQKQTWATLAAIEPKVPPKSVATSTAPAATTKAAPAAKKFPSPPQPAQNIRYKKEEWYPIYIKNVEVEEDELKTSLIKEFGDIKYFKKSSKTALCDFRNKEDQLKALEAKEITIGNNRILLEPRVHKAYNNKPDAKKDKKVLKKPPVKKA